MCWSKNIILHYSIKWYTLGLVAMLGKLILHFYYNKFWGMKAIPHSFLPKFKCTMPRFSSQELR